MKSLADKFLALNPAQRRVVHFALCERALREWNQYANAQGRIQYTESVIGTRQEVDQQLPVDALESAKRGVDFGQVQQRYQEPMTAMQEDDLRFPEPIIFAYYAIYNLFGKYVCGEPIDDWLIVNQALSAETDREKWEALLNGALQAAAQ
jgi:hypothetical protein